jgi:hypothetical protein
MQFDVDTGRSVRIDGTRGAGSPALLGGLGLGRRERGIVTTGIMPMTDPFAPPCSGGPFRERNLTI